MNGARNTTTNVVSVNKQAIEHTIRVGELPAWGLSVCFSHKTRVIFQLGNIYTLNSYDVIGTELPSLFLFLLFQRKFFCLLSGVRRWFCSGDFFISSCRASPVCLAWFCSVIFSVPSYRASPVCLAWFCSGDLFIYFFLQGLSSVPGLQHLSSSHNHLPHVKEIDKCVLLHSLNLQANNLQQV